MEAVIEIEKLDEADFGSVKCQSAITYDTVCGREATHRVTYHCACPRQMSCFVCDDCLKMLIQGHAGCARCGVRAVYAGEL